MRVELAQYLCYDSIDLHSLRNHLLYRLYVVGSGNTVDRRLLRPTITFDVINCSSSLVYHRICPITKPPKYLTILRIFITVVSFVEQY